MKRNYLVTIDIPEEVSTVDQRNFICNAIISRSLQYRQQDDSDPFGKLELVRSIKVKRVLDSPPKRTRVLKKKQ